MSMPSAATVRRERRVRTRAAAVSAGTAAVFCALRTATPADAVTGGSAIAFDGTDGFTARIEGQFGCTGAQVAPQWVITASTCFGPGPVQPGPPYTVTLGRANLTHTTVGHTVAITTLVPAQDRAVVLAKLAVPVMDTQRVHIAGSAPVHGDVLHADGFGRTATTWVPDQLTTATFSVDAVTDTTLT